MGESTVRDVIEITLGGKTYPFARPVIARRREFQKASLRLAELWENLEFDSGDTLKPKQSAKNMLVFMEITERILDTLAEFCPAVRGDIRSLKDKFNAGEVTDAEVGMEWGKLKEFVSAPFGQSRESAAPADTSASG